jgi:hypothetical protein
VVKYEVRPFSFLNENDEGGVGGLKTEKAGNGHKERKW